MKILFTGGSSGGHFYPIIAVVQALHERVAERKVLPPEIYFMSNVPYNNRILFENEIKYIPTTAGKWRRYFSILNFLDIFKTLIGCLIAVIKVYRLYPDVVFGKGGYSSFPAIFAARIWRIPVIIHESDSHPGRVNLWAGKFARKIAVSYQSAARYFGPKQQDKIAFTGNPIRPSIAKPLQNGARELLKLEPDVPVILILGGSMGSAIINETIIQSLPELLNKYIVIHQTGKANLTEMQNMAGVVLKDHLHKGRYHPYDYLNELTLRMAAGVAEVVISRAGSTIFEIAAWGIPSIIIPLSKSVSHDQTSNAFAYAATGAATVIEEYNLYSHILISEINRIHDSSTIKETMKKQALGFSRLDSAAIIADTILDIALEHEK